MNLHLTSEELERVLADEASRRATAHLLVCADCAAEVEDAQHLFTGLRADATATAEQAQRQLPAIQRQVVQRQVVPRQAVQRQVVPRDVPRRVFQPRWALATAVLLAVATTPLALRHRAAATVAPGRVASTPAGTEAMSDDALLSSVQNDLSSTVPQSLLPLTDTPTEATQNK